MAYHSVQASRLGIPQMIQSRAQSGTFGAVPDWGIVICNAVTLLMAWVG